MKKLILLSLIFIAGCSLESRVFKHEAYVRQLLGVPDSIVINHDSIVETEVSTPDSGYLMAYFECNDSNQVLMKRIESLKSKGVQTIIKYRDNVLYYDFKTDSARIAKSIIDKYSQEKVRTIEVDKRSTLEYVARLEQKVSSRNKAIWILSCIIAALVGLHFLLKRL